MTTDQNTEADRVVPFAEGPETWAEAVDDAPPADVWELVADPATPAAFSREFRRAEWVEGHEGPGPGARWIGHNGRGETTWQTECWTVAFDPPSRLAYEVHVEPEPLATWSFELTDLGDGRTRLRHHVHLGPGRSGLTWAIRNDPDNEVELVANRLASLRRNMQAVVDGIAAKAVS